MPAKYEKGQAVRVVLLLDSQGKKDARIEKYINKTGEVAESYVVPMRELPDVKSSADIKDLYLYAVRLYDGTLIEAIPEEALEPIIYEVVK